MLYCVIIRSKSRHPHCVFINFYANVLFDKKNSGLLYLYSFMFLLILSLLYYYGLYKHDINCYFFYHQSNFDNNFSMTCMEQQPRKHATTPVPQYLLILLFHDPVTVPPHCDIALFIALVLLHFFLSLLKLNPRSTGPYIPGFHIRRF